jgi:hypothetical protein
MITREMTTDSLGPAYSTVARSPGHSMCHPGRGVSLTNKGASPRNDRIRTRHEMTFVAHHTPRLLGES